jgi:hypothetical protein
LLAVENEQFGSAVFVRGVGAAQELALEVGEADLAFVSVLNQSDHFALVRNDLHGGKIIRAQQTGQSLESGRAPTTYCKVYQSR